MKNSRGDSERNSTFREKHPNPHLRHRPCCLVQDEMRGKSMGGCRNSFRELGLWLFIQLQVTEDLRGWCKWKPVRGTRNGGVRVDGGQGNAEVRRRSGSCFHLSALLFSKWVSGSLTQALLMYWGKWQPEASRLVHPWHQWEDCCSF